MGCCKFPFLYIFTEESNLAKSRLQSASILKGGANNDREQVKNKKRVTLKLPCMHHNVNGGKDEECSGWTIHPAIEGGCCCSTMRTPSPGEKEPVSHEPCQDAPVAEIVSDVTLSDEPRQDDPYPGIISALASMAISEKQPKAAPRLPHL